MSNQKSFIVYLERDTFNAVLTLFFKQVGYIDANDSLEFTLAELNKGDQKIHLEANVVSESVN